MLALFIPLLSLPISALAFLAYSHPTGYARLFVPLSIATFSSSVIFVTYQIGHSIGFSAAISDFMALNSSNIISHPDILIKFPSHDIAPLWGFMIPVVVFIYLVFLRFLPNILGIAVKYKDDIS